MQQCNLECIQYKVEEYIELIIKCNSIHFNENTQYGGCCGGAGAGRDELSSHYG